MASAAMLPASIHLAVPECLGRGGFGRQSDAATSDDDFDGGIGGSGMFGGG